MSWIDGLRHRLRTWTHPRAYAREQAEERRFHREMELRARADGPVRDGLGPGVPSPRDRPSRRATVLEVLLEDLGYGIRGLSRSPGFSALAIITLALGVGANGAVFSLLDRIYGQPPPGLTTPDDLNRLYLRFPDDYFEPGMVYRWFSYPALSAVDDALGASVEVAGWTRSSESSLVEANRTHAARTSYVTNDYFAVLGVDAAYGRLFTPDEEGVDVPRNVAVISHAFWARAFGSDPSVLGRTLALEGTTYTVVGVAAEGFAGLDLSYTDAFLHASTFPVWGGGTLREWTGGNVFQAVARVGGDVDDAPLEARGTAGYRQVVRDHHGQRLVTGSIIEARGAGRRARTAVERQALSISERAAGMSAILLFIACANVAGLLLLRAGRRRREIAVRLALGVSSGRLMSRLLTEGLVLATASAAASVVVSVWGGVLLRSLLLPDVAWAGSGVEPRTVGFAVASALGAGLLTALAPLPTSGRVDITSGLQAGGRNAAPPPSTARTGLLVGQVALSIVLLVGAALFVRSLHNVAALRLGFDIEELAWVDPGPPSESEDPGARTELAAALGRLPGVAGTALARYAPMRGLARTRVFRAARDSLPSEVAFPAQNVVSADFFAVAGMGVREGRTFEEDELGVAVVSEAMSRSLWPGESALGRCLIVGRSDGPCLDVIGVVEDSRRDEIIEDAREPWYFLPRGPTATGGTILLRVRPKRWGAVAAAARDEAARRFDSRAFLPPTGARAGGVRVGRMTDTLEPQLRPWRLGARLFTAFGILALVVTVVGLYSSLAYAVSRRTHEMGVRMALGARLGDILRLVVGEGLRVVALGVGLGALAALAAGRLVESLLFGVTPRDPLALTAAAAVLLATGVAASLVPAWAAGRVQPAAALRQE